MAKKLSRRQQDRLAWDVEMLQAIARDLLVPVELVYEAWAKETRYRIKCLEAEAETSRMRAESARMRVEAYQAILEDMRREQRENSRT